ncbi:hypothetical protein SLEP1_g33154 [Rubroshorea leprosula]|uniref:Uncharacterized protein n=1 Tax=Rubroshorea leprosula TaxID=152421 RepID=A0AAV5KFS1_9ROSI|nr:hypothetical protein SLEP1_g33154 [Rubroshorea leprosula]
MQSVTTETLLCCVHEMRSSDHQCFLFMLTSVPCSALSLY